MSGNIPPEDGYMSRTAAIPLVIDIIFVTYVIINGDTGAGAYKEA